MNGKIVINFNSFFSATFTALFSFHLIMSKQETEPIIQEEEFIEVVGAAEHNLKNIDVRIPKNKLVEITGLSGSGKSSLAFDTLYDEGQPSFMETFSTYARQLLGSMERPELVKLNGVS